MSEFAGQDLPDLSGDHPAGPNLEFDPDFVELLRLAQGKPEQQYGSTVVPAEEPEWREVNRAASALMARTYDLRVMSLRAVARLQQEGVDGYAAGLADLAQTLERRWASVHPQLDPEDDNDPTLRANALLTVAEPLRVLRVLRTLPLAWSARGGAVSWRDIGIASGAIEVPPKTPKLTDAAITGIFRETDRALLVQRHRAVASALASVIAIPAVFDRESGFGTGPDYTELAKLLRELDAILAARTPAEAAAPEPDPVAEPVAEPGAAAAPVAAMAAPVMSIATMGPPTNRADALRLLDLVIEFYERYEPSSPLPLLITRARRLADMNFMDVLRDMAPDGLPQAARIAGVTEQN